MANNGNWSRSPKTTEPFIMVPEALVTHPSFLTLPSISMRILLVMATRFKGSNNGSISFPFAAAEELGITHSKPTFVDALQELEVRGLIIKTRQGGTSRVNLFALGWRGIDKPNAMYPHGATANAMASDLWRQWTPPEEIGRYGWTINRGKRCTSKWTKTLRNRYSRPQPKKIKRGTSRPQPIGSHGHNQLGSHGHNHNGTYGSHGHNPNRFPWPQPHIDNLNVPMAAPGEEGESPPDGGVEEDFKDGR
jgi:hypothetical protein